MQEKNKYTLPVWPGQMSRQFRHFIVKMTKNKNIQNFMNKVALYRHFFDKKTFLHILMYMYFISQAWKMRKNLPSHSLRKFQQGIGALLILLWITLWYVLYAAITDITTSSVYIADGTSSWSLITQITTQDWQAPYMYTLVSGIWSEDNSLFFISWDSVWIHFTPDYLNPIDIWGTPNDNEYSVRIQSQDSTKISSFAYDFSSGLNTHWWWGNSDTEPNLYVYAGIKNDGSIIARGSVLSNGGSWFPIDTWYVKIFPNSQAFAALKDDWSIRVRGNLLGGWAGGPTWTWYVKIFSNGQAFAALKDDWSITARGNPTAWSVWAPTDTGYIYISSTSSAFAALKPDGSIFTWGNSSYGWAGGPTWTWYVKIFSTISAFAALKDDWSLFTWGSSSYGWAGGPTWTWYVDVFSAGLWFSSLKDDWSLFCWWWGYGSAPSGTGFEKVSVAVHAFAAIKDDSSVVARGYAGNGGVWAPTDTGYVKVFATNNAFAALKDDGSIFAWWATSYWGTWAPADNGYINISSNAFAFAAIKPDGSITARGDINNGGSWAPSGTWYSRIVSTQRSFIAIKNDTSPYFRGNYSYGWSWLPSSFASIYTKNLFFTVTKDVDNDGIQDADDNCPLVSNPWQEDTYIASWPSVSFTKADYADWTLPEHQDCITANVCITRKDSQGIYNAVTESWYDQIWYTSPDDTERAYGNCINHSSLSFYTWNNAVWSDPTVLTVTGMVGKDMCLHLIQDDEYYDIVFTQWTPSAAWGWFAYTRSENIPAVGDACDCTDSLCTVGNDTNNNLICSPRDTACPIPPSGGWGGGWWWMSTDDCPNGDYSPSYYDGSCWTNTTSWWLEHGSATTIPNPITIDKRLTRADVAIMVGIFAKNQLWIQPNKKISCLFTDISKLSTAHQLLLKQACQLWLIGLHKDWETPQPKFRPKAYITDNEFITVLSRLLYDGKNNLPLISKENRYSKHITTLQKNQLIPDIPQQIRTSLLIHILSLILEHPEMVQRN